MAKDSDKKCRLVIFSQGYDKRYPLEIERLNSIDCVYASDNFRHQNLLLKGLRRIHILSRLPGLSFWLGEWKRFLPECDTLICMANIYSSYLLRWVKKHYPDIKCINYFWDEVLISGCPVIKTEEFDNWSLCRWDCRQYGFYYNPQFYAESVNLPDVPVEYDVVFIGAERIGETYSRAAELKKDMELFKDKNVTSFIWFVGDNQHIPEEVRKSRRLSEEEYLLATAKAKAVLDLVDPEHPWMTLRPLLALSNGKKVITNSTAIKDEKYYSDANVFILGHDPDDLLNEFIGTPFEKIPEDALNFYEASEWIKRFDEKQ